MSFEDFLGYVRETLGNRGSNSFWKEKYNEIKNMPRDKMKAEIKFLAPHAVAEKENLK